MGKDPGEVYEVTASSACSFIRAILLVRKPVSNEHRRLLDNDMKSILSSFKKGSPLLAVQTSLTNVSRNRTYQIPVKLLDFLKNTVEILFVRFPQEFGGVRREFGDTTNDLWNSMVDTTDVLSKFLNIIIKPIVTSLDEAQLKRAKSARIEPNEMWATSSFENMQKARVGGEAPRANVANATKPHGTKRKTPDQGARQASANVATDKGRAKGKGKSDGGKSSKGSGNSKGGSKGGSKGKGGKEKGTPNNPTFRPNCRASQIRHC